MGYYGFLDSFQLDINKCYLMDFNEYKDYTLLLNLDDIILPIHEIQVNYNDELSGNLSSQFGFFMLDNSRDCP
jgi:hypothetical protein